MNDPEIEPDHVEGAQPKAMQRPGGRTERVRKQVIAATVAVLAEDGVSGVSVESVASRSGVARTTIYRRWGTPQALMLEALLEELGPRSSRVADTGSLRGDIKAVLEDVLAFNTSEQGRGIMQAVFIQRSSADIASAVQAYWARRFDAVGEIVRRAVARGELSADVPEDLIIEMAASPLYFRLFILWQTVDDAYLDQIVDRVLRAFGARGAGLEAGLQERTAPRAL
jgi:AcrR family transcriptional regulator